MNITGEGQRHKRADIWSFGVVLWEMLTGQRLFDGETISHTLADVLRGPIDLDTLAFHGPAEVPRPDGERGTVLSPR